jgi:hypothetical protein
VPIVTKQLREGSHYIYRILAVGERLPDGRLHCPVFDFLADADSLEPSDLRRLSAALERTARMGPLKNEAKFRHLTDSDKIFEFKTSGTLRLFCFFDENRVIVCTGGLIKKGQKPPSEEIRKAEGWKNRYFEAQGLNQLSHESEHPRVP